MIVENFPAFAAAATVLILVPGPTNMVIMSNAAAVGFKRSLWAVAGASVSHILFLSITALGLTTLLMASVEIFEMLRWLGVVYLVWLGIRQWVSTDSSGDIPAEGSSMPPWQCFMQGFAVNTTNPKAIVFYAGFFPPFVNPSASAVPQFILLGSVFIAVFIILAGSHAFIAARMGAVLDQRNLRLRNRISGTILIGSGILIGAASNR